MYKNRLLYIVLTSLYINCMMLTQACAQSELKASAEENGTSMSNKDNQQNTSLAGSQTAPMGVGMMGVNMMMAQQMRHAPTEETLPEEIMQKLRAIVKLEKTEGSARRIGSTDWYLVQFSRQIPELRDAPMGLTQVFVNLPEQRLVKQNDWNGARSLFDQLAKQVLVSGDDSARNESVRLMADYAGRFGYSKSYHGLADESDDTKPTLTLQANGWTLVFFVHVNNGSMRPYTDRCKLVSTDEAISFENTIFK